MVTQDNAEAKLGKKLLQPVIDLADSAEEALPARTSRADTDP
jgi:hypothetical protein